MGIAQKTVVQLCKNITAVIQCLRKALNRTLLNCYFELQELDFLGRSLRPAKLAPQAHL